MQAFLVSGVWYTFGTHSFYQFSPNNQHLLSSSMKKRAKSPL